MGKVAVITGAGSGIGRAVAIALSARGYRLILAGRRSDALAETSALCAAAEVPPLCIVTDVTDRAAVQALFAAALDAFGRIDLLFNNAGAGLQGVAIDAIDEADWRRVIDTNLTGSFFCLQAAFAVMKAQVPRGGRIINNGSISAAVPRPLSIAYTASKHAVTGMTKATSLDGRDHDIACCQIDIGNAATAMGSRMAGGVLQADGSIRVEPVMPVADVGETVAFMDSLSLESNIQFVTLMATRMPFVGRG